MNSIIISLGGSLIVPNEIDTEFLKNFKSILLKYQNKYDKIVIVCGGGSVARKYIDALKHFNKNMNSLDEVGIKSTHLNAELIKNILKLNEPIITNPKEKRKYKIVVAGGYMPGFSTDYVSVLIAKNMKINSIINLTNIEYVYDKDPRKYSDAKKLEKINWKTMQKIVGTKWNPGKNAPFDPIATKLCKKLKLKVIIAKGSNLNNLKQILDNKKFIGTVIE